MRSVTFVFLVIFFGAAELMRAANDAILADAIAAFAEFDYQIARLDKLARQRNARDVVYRQQKGDWI